MRSNEKTTEQLEEDLRKTREELAIQKWGTEKTLGGMKVLVKELIQKGKEVEKLNKTLEEKTKERISELEKMNKFMVDRELKMVELKKENEELRERIKKG